MSEQNQLVIRHPLAIPEILENVFEFLPNTDLVRLTYVSKMWRLVARHKLYQNRSEIIYKSLKWFLKDFRYYYGNSPWKRDISYITPSINKSVRSVNKFRRVFGLNLRVELFAIRNRLKEQEKTAKAKSDNVQKNFSEAYELFCADPESTEKYNLFRRLEQEDSQLAEDKYNTRRDLLNFEYYLRFF